MKETEEQLLIINSNEDEVIVEAKAGGGKTTTLVEFAKNRPFQTILYLAYNDSVRKSAMKRFFGNTKVHTIHSLAFEHIGHFYKDQLTENVHSKHIIQHLPKLKQLQLEDPSNQDVYLKASSVSDLLNIFFNSKELTLDKFESTEIRDLAEEYWDMMQDLSCTQVKMTHDGYLKLFQSSQIILNYNYILVDEAQDSNEVMLDIVLRQKSKKVFVGDRHQEIYAFRKVTNIFKDSRFNSYKKYYLTQSFRFSKSIEYLANKVLEDYTDETVFVTGVSNNKDEIVHAIDEKEVFTVITRTNAHLFDLAVEYCLKNKKVSIIGGTNFVFEELTDCLKLFKGALFNIKNPYFKKFGSFRNLKDIAEKTNDVDLIFLIKVVEKYEDRLGEYIALLERKLIAKQEYADVTLTTIHKSKGLEFENVKLANDYYKLFFKDGKRKPPLEIPYEEVNLYYVAITRAMRKIEMNTCLSKIA